MSHSRTPRLNSLRSRMLLIFLVLLTLITTTTLFIVNSTTYQHSTGQLKNLAQTAASVVQDKVQNRARVLHEGLVTASNNFNLRSLIYDAENDPESLASAMKNFQTRNNADIFWITDNQGQPLENSLSQVNLPTSPNQVIGGEINWVKHNEAFYLIQAAPIKKTASSRNIDYWLLMGIAANKLINEDLVNLTAMEVSLVRQDDEHWVIASTFDSENIEDLKKADLITNASLQEIALGDSTFVYAAYPMGVWQQAQVFKVLAINKNSAYISYTSLLSQLAGILGLAALLSLAGAMLLSNGITKPIAKLSNSALKISGGDYQVELPSQSIQEVNVLSAAFKQMISGLKEREQKIHYLAYYDELTGLPNRLQFNDAIRQKINQPSSTEITILMLDIDHFKDINDTVGHDTGDTLLNLIAQRMMIYAGENTLYARIGGDEFGIILDESHGQTPEAFAQSIADLFERPFVIDGLTLDVNVSIGVAVYPHSAKTAEDLIQCADIALYSGKGQHSPFTLYKTELNKYSVQRLNLMSELKESLSQGQLELYYQPKLSIDENQIQTVECLIRWNHPEHGFIPPDEFIPLAEQTGSIRHVTHWALRAALKQQNLWHRQGYDIGMAVNISAVDLVDMKLPTYVSELLSEFHVEAQMLTLEVTESAIMGNPDNAMKALNTLRRMGITLSIDDFGTGYSSMAQLKKMPVDELKIDKAFVLDLAKSQEDQVMVKTVISLAQNLGLKTVAEGVEDAQSLEYLAAIGCTKAQGFYLSRPLPANKFEDWYTQFLEQQQTQTV
ncbi:bifunctional diguanylate cyclase/phosphodiesterase [Marinibactrum halimedae]|nr:EAL domain-containing protein [Marinibactrum halimedae]